MQLAMPQLEILHPGLLTTVQDMGREGSQFFAIARAGVMDRDAAMIALLLLRMDRRAPLLECTSLAPKIRFHGSAQIALTGADFQWTLNEVPVPLNTVLEVQDGDVLAGQHAQDQFRGYLAVRGQWGGKAVYGSFSTDLNGKFGGHCGRRLQKGDWLTWDEQGQSTTDFPGFPLRKGPEFHWLTEAAQVALVNTPFEIGRESNRMGARLLGPQLAAKGYQMADSVPVLPGFVQLPPSGQPIVVLQDGQVSGGYPRIAYLPDAALSAFNQVPLGRSLRFYWACDPGKRPPGE